MELQRMTTTTTSESPRPKLTPLKMVRLDLTSDHPQTAPIMEETIVEMDEEDDNRIRTYSLSHSKRQSEAPQRRHQRLIRQKTLSGDSNVSGATTNFGSNIFMRALSRTYTLTSNGSSNSFATEEWKKLFDRFDMEHNGRVDGKIPVKDFEKVRYYFIIFMRGTLQ